MATATRKDDGRKEKAKGGAEEKRRKQGRKDVDTAGV